MKNILGHKLTQLTTAVFILLGVYIIMYPPDIEFFRKTSEFAVQVMFGMLILSLGFLVFNQTRLMFISMLACGLLAFYLKTASNSAMILPEQNNLPKVKVAHFNLSSFNKGDDQLEKLILGTDSEVLSFQEYTPDWDLIISNFLHKKFPHTHRRVRIDLFGMGIYSKKPIKKTEIFYYKEIPNINVTIHNGYQDINIVSAYIAPPSIQSKNIKTEEHLAAVSDYIKKLKNPTVALGDFNQVYWTNDIKTFRDNSELSNSRRNVSLTTKVPYDHIFYSDLLECIQFWEINDREQNHLGIAGVYQIKTSVSNPAILRTISENN